MALKLNLNCILYVYIYNSISYKQDLNLGASEAEADLFLSCVFFLSVWASLSRRASGLQLYTNSFDVGASLVDKKKKKNENAHFHSNTVFLRPGVIESECITFLFCFVYMKINE